MDSSSATDIPPNASTSIDNSIAILRNSNDQDNQPSPNGFTKAQDQEERGAMLLAAVSQMPKTSSMEAEPVNTASAITALNMLVANDDMLDDARNARERDSQNRRPGRPRLPKNELATALARNQLSAPKAQAIASPASKIPLRVQKALEQGNGTAQPKPPAPTAPAKRPADQRPRPQAAIPPMHPLQYQFSPLQVRGYSPDQWMLLQALAQQQQQLQQNQALLTNPQMNANQLGAMAALGAWTNPVTPAPQADKHDLPMSTDTASLIETLNNTATTLTKLVPVLHEIVDSLKSRKHSRDDSTTDSDEITKLEPPAKRVKTN